MKVRLKPNLLVVTAETPEEQGELVRWAGGADERVFALVVQDEQTVRLTSLGRRADACREPINVTSRATDPAVRLISNFAATPFELDGRAYGSVEAFWQGLKFPDEERRRVIAPLHGDEARRAGFDAPAAAEFEYAGRTVRIGTADHWALMSAACRAKFTQHPAARLALLATGDRPLAYKTRKDSKTIPGVVMADIWMRVRRWLRNRDEPDDDAGEGEAET